MRICVKLIHIHANSCIFMWCQTKLSNMAPKRNNLLFQRSKYQTKPSESDLPTFQWPWDFSEEGLFIRDKEPAYLVSAVPTRQYADFTIRQVDKENQVDGGQINLKKSG